MQRNTSIHPGEDILRPLHLNTLLAQGNIRKLSLFVAVVPFFMVSILGAIAFAHTTTRSTVTWLSLSGSGESIPIMQTTPSAAQMLDKTTAAATQQATITTSNFWSRSFYESDANQQRLYAEGNAEGCRLKNAFGTTNYTNGAAGSSVNAAAALVILDFYHLTTLTNGTYGTNTGYTMDQVRLGGESFAQGFWDCTHGTIPLELGYGFSSSLWGTTDHWSMSAGEAEVQSQWYAAGSAWGKMVVQAQQEINTKFNKAIFAVSGCDCETDMVQWASPRETIALVDGYLNGSNSQIPLLDYGDDTPQAPWTAQEAWYIAYGCTQCYAIPEIYVQAQIPEWQQLNTWAVQNGKGPIYFTGIMTENGDQGAGQDMPMQQAINNFYSGFCANPATCVAVSKLKFRTNI